MGLDLNSPGVSSESPRIRVDSPNRYGFEMILIRRLQMDEVELFKRIRLASLREAPYAFSSTYESALLRSDESWRRQVEESAQGADRATFIAFFDNRPVGISSLYRIAARREKGELLQVWVAPEYRGTRITWNLMDTVFMWAAENAFETILAQVTCSNIRSIRFYRKYGFMMSDEVPLDSSDIAILTREIESKQPHQKDPVA